MPDIAPKAAIYARYSSDLQSAASIEDQVRGCTARIEAEGWQLANVYTDHGISGASTLRPGYQQLLQDGRSGAFAIVVAEGLDRLSRDQEDVAALYKHLSFAGVRLITLAEGEISELHVGLKGTMNALYLKDLAQKTRRGLEGRVRQGRSGGGLCYGYDVVDSADDKGRRTVNETEAEIVRRIFRDYAGGVSPKAIAHALNSEGIAGPRSGAWGASTIHGNRARGTGILNNELYAGRLVWNRLRYVKDPTTGKRLSRPNPEAEWIVQEVPELRIVDEELWQAARARQEDLVSRRRQNDNRPGFWDRRRPRFLLSGLMRCGVCGGGYSKISATQFGCSTARNKGTCDNRLNIRRDVIEATVLEALRTRLMEPRLVEAFAQGYIEEANRARLQAGAHRQRLEAERARNAKRIAGLVDAIAEGTPPKALMEELRRLETRQDQLEAELTQAPETIAPLLHPSMAQRYREQVEELLAFLEEEEHKAEATEAIRSMICEVVLTPEDGELRIDLKGELATILRLCRDGKTTKPAGGPDGLAV